VGPLNRGADGGLYDRASGGQTRKKKKKGANGDFLTAGEKKGRGRPVPK